LPSLEQLLKELLRALDPATRAHLAIIGGQALSLWAYRYLLDELTGEEVAFLASDDLDFLGRMPAIQRCADAWHVDYELPEPFDNTPNTGLIRLHRDLADNLLLDESGVQNPVLIDFLGSVHGINDRELNKGLDTFDFGDGLTIQVLTPALCLQSRLMNLCTLGYPETLVARERVRVRLAASSTKRYLLDMLEDPCARKKALFWANLVLDLGKGSCGVRMAVIHGVDLLAAIPEKHPGFGSHFPSHFAAVRGKILMKRASYLDRRLAAGLPVSQAS
jgi:hypothetical protein